MQQAEHSIDMIYFAFDHGEWAGKISPILQQKAADGVQVRLMVDELGMVVDNLQKMPSATGHWWQSLGPPACRWMFFDLLAAV